MNELCEELVLIFLCFNAAMLRELRARARMVVEKNCAPSIS